jgi:putative addiction module CopG family antidote
MLRPLSQSVSLTPELGQLGQAQIASGRCPTASEVIHDGMRLHQERNSAQSRFEIGATTPEGGCER